MLTLINSELLVSKNINTLYNKAFKQLIFSRVIVSSTKLVKKFNALLIKLLESSLKVFLFSSKSSFDKGAVWSGSFVLVIEIVIFNPYIIQDYFEEYIEFKNKYPLFKETFPTFNKFYNSIPKYKPNSIIYHHAIRTEGRKYHNLYN